MALIWSLVQFLIENSPCYYEVWRILGYAIFPSSVNTLALPCIWIYDLLERGWVHLPVWVHIRAKGTITFFEACFLLWQKNAIFIINIWISDRYVGLTNFKVWKIIMHGAYFNKMTFDQDSKLPNISQFFEAR